VVSSRGVNDQSFDPKLSQSGEYTASSFVEVLSSTAMTSARVFRRAFETLRKPRGKRTESAASFAALLTAIAPLNKRPSYQRASGSQPRP